MPVTVILNAMAGSAVPDHAAEIAGLFAASRCPADIVRLQPGDDPREAARTAALKSAVVVAAGGDGTVNAVAAGILGTPAILGILPLGTLNHCARDLGLPMAVDQAVRAIAARRVGTIEVGEVDGRLFLNNSSIGVYPDIIDLRDALRRQGYQKWQALALATLRVLRRHRGVVVRIDVDGQSRVERTPFVFVGNNEYQLDGGYPGTRTRLDEGWIYAYLAPRVRTRALPLLLAKTVIGQGRRSGAFEIVRATELTIHTAKVRALRVACDGELATMTTPLHYRVRAAALKVVLP